MVSFRLAGDPGCTEFDVFPSLRAYGWRVPAYTMPDNASDVAVLRVGGQASPPTWPGR